MKQMRFLVTAGILMVLCVSLSPASGGERNGLSDGVVNIGFTKSLFSDVNINDAMAAIEVWADTIASSKGIPLEMKVTVFETSARLEAALKEEGVDLVGLLTPDLMDMGRRVGFDHLFATRVRNSIFEEYVLLVREVSGYTDLSQLAGTTLNVLNNGRCSLSQAWLERFMEQHGLPGISDHFDAIQLENKANMVILPVFFGKADACLVTRNSFETMAEMNPQVGRTLRVIAQSPPYVPAVFCFRSGFRSEYLDRILEGLDELHTQPSGEQVLLVFRGDRLVRVDEEDLESARNLLEP